MIGQLDRAEVDMAAACLTISVSRAQAVDFTKIILAENVVVLLPLADPSETKWQIYGQPYKLQVWLTIIGSILAGSLVLYGISRLTHYLRETTSVTMDTQQEGRPQQEQRSQEDQSGEDHRSEENQRSEGQRSEESRRSQEIQISEDKPNSEETQMNNRYSCVCCAASGWIIKDECAIHNLNKKENSGLPFAVWFTYGSALGQGSILSSKSLTVRWFMSCWWLGCVILGATYSANLVAFLSTERYGPVFSTPEQLVEQNQLKLGVVGGTALDDFFLGKNTKLSKLYQRIRDKILLGNNTDPEVLSKSPQEHIEKVSRGGYGFIDTPGGMMGAIQEHRHLTYIDFGLGTGLSQYAFAVQKQSVYKEMIDDKLQSFLEQGLLVQWQKEHAAAFPEASSMKVTAKHIRLRDCQGAFYTLLVILALSGIIFLVEYTWFNRQTLRDNLTQLCWFKRKPYINNQMDT